MDIIEPILSFDFWLLFFIGVLASVIGALFGAAGLVTLPAMLIAGIPIHISIAANKFATGLSAFTNVLSFIKTKQLRWKHIKGLVPTAIMGGVAGAFVTTLLNEQTMNIVASVLLLVAFAVVMLNRTFLKEVHPSGTPKSVTLYPPLIISMYDGGFGAGSATMSITYYVSKNYRYRKAVKLSRVIICASCLGGFGWFYAQGFLVWSIAIPVALGSIIGSHAGIVLLPKLPMKIVRWVLPVIFLALIIQVFLELF